jgi:quercetin dioxygenase-like cupin family protein/DNA-binding XRE family transcriptional regulator
MAAPTDGSVNEGDVGDSTARLGSVIRSHRAGRFTLQELASAAGISVGLLSQIERGMGNPSYKTLQKLADALELRIGDLVDPTVPSTRGGTVVRTSERTRVQFGSEGLVYEFITPNLRGRLEMLQTSVPPGWGNRGHPFHHEGEECVLVVEGELAVEVDGVEHTLSAGDAITYDSGAPHWWENRSTEPAVILGAVTPPSF